MKHLIRKSAAKVWETSFRQTFTTTYLKDPDLHVLIYVSGENFNEIIREALRDYMTKHGSKAADPDFQAKVFITASIKMARGDQALASDVLSKIESKYSEDYSDGELGQSASDKRQNSISAQVESSSSTTTVSNPPLAHAKSTNEANPANHSPAASSNSSKPEFNLQSTVKPKVVLDFGADMGTFTETNDAEEIRPIPPKNSWLVGHDT